MYIKQVENGYCPDKINNYMRNEMGCGQQGILTIHKGDSETDKHYPENGMN
jgi:hypothetical protein